MSDPAVEAVRRAHTADCHGCTEVMGELAAAREALAPIREWYERRDRDMADLRALIYTSEELNDD